MPPSGGAVFGFAQTLRHRILEIHVRSRLQGCYRDLGMEPVGTLTRTASRLSIQEMAIVGMDGGPGTER